MNKRSKHNLIYIMKINKYFRITTIFKERKENSQLKMVEYASSRNAWLKEDNCYLSNSYTIIKDINKFQCADFEIVENDNIISIKKKYKWTQINTKNQDKDNNSEIININKDNNDEINDNKSENDNNHNIILKNKILSLEGDCIALRSLGLELKISILMSGESNFYIFTRCKESGFDESTAVCCISKELKSARKFISFGVLVKDDEDNFLIKNLKKQEIPHQTHHIEELDLSEISFTFLDNGDNKCFVFLDEKEENSSNMQLMGDFFEPIKEICNVMLACTGDLVSLKELEIKHIMRDSYVNYRNNNNVNVQCCNVF